MAAAIENDSVLRVAPEAGEDIGVTRYLDPLTDTLLKGEQVAAYGHPTRWVKIAASVSSAGDYPSKGAITVAAGDSVADEIAFSGALPAGSPVGLLAWITQAGANQHQVRKLVSEDDANEFKVNRDWAAATAPSAGDTYELLIHSFRFNQLYVKAEFSGSTDTCVILPSYFSVNQNNVHPIPDVAKPIRYHGDLVTIDNLGLQNINTEETDYYHGRTVAVPCQGSLGMKIRLISITGGFVSLWVAGV